MDPGHAEWDVLCPVNQRTAAQGTIDAHWATGNDMIMSVFIDDDQRRSWRGGMSALAGARGG